MRGVTLRVAFGLLLLTPLVHAEKPVSSSCAQPALAVGHYVPITYPGAANTIIAGVNERGDMIGTYVLPGETSQHAFLLRQGEFMSLEVPDADETLPLGLNNRGMVVGYYRAGTTPAAFAWWNGRFTTFRVAEHETFFGAINAAGQIVGSYFDSSAYRYQAFLLEQDALTLLGPADPNVSSLARDVNERGEVLINLNLLEPQGLPSWYVLAGKDGLTAVTPCAGPGLWLRWTNQGQLAGYLSLNGQTPVGAIQSRDGGLTVYRYPGATWTGVYGITNSGRVVGVARFDEEGYDRFVGFQFVPREKR